MNVNYPDLRSAAEILFNSSTSSQQIWRYPHLPPSSFPPRPMMSQEDFATGVVRSGRMSDVRRSFCLLVLFDLLLTLLIWFICMMLITGGGDIVHVLIDQVLHYHIQKSFFDIVLSAISRFFFLQLIYGCLRINHWWAVAISTFLTCLFLIAKVFVYDWAEANQPILQVMLILVTFVLSWSEVWFLDSRVLPQETQAREYLHASNLYNTSDQNPLLRGLGINAALSADNPESIANFYSPIESPAGSDYEVENHQSRAAEAALNEENEYRKRAKDILQSAWSLMSAPDWREVQKTPNGDVIECLQLPKANKIFRLTGRFQFPPSYLLEELFSRVDQLTSWNKTLVESKRLKVIDDQLDITYQVSAPGAGGVVKSRDFVLLRHWDMQDDAYVLAACSICLPSMPTTKHVRGESGPCCFVIRPIDGEEGWCDLQWLVNTTLNGWLPIPKAAIDSGFVSSMNQYAQHLRDHAANLHKTGLLK